MTNKLFTIVVMAAIALVWWAYAGFPSPDAFFLNSDSAREKYVEFAEKNKEKLFFDVGVLLGGARETTSIRAVDSWRKNGKIVVEIGAFQNNKPQGGETYIPRICVVDNSSIQIVSLLENGAWH